MADSVTIHHSTGNGGHADFVPTMIASVALGMLFKVAEVINLVSRDYENVVAQQGSTVQIPKRGTLTASTKSTVDTKFVVQQPEGDKVSIDIQYYDYVDFVVEDRAEAFSAVKNAMGYAGDAVKVLVKKCESRLLSLYTGFTLVLGSAGGGLCDTAVNGEVKDSALLRRCRQAFSEQEAPTEDRYLITAPEGYGELISCKKFTEAPNLGDNSAIRNGYVGRIYGFDTFESMQIVETGVSPKTQHNIAFQRNGLALVTRALPLPPASAGVSAVYAELNGIGIRIVSQYDMDYGGMRHRLEILYGVGILDTRLCVHLMS